MGSETLPQAAIAGIILLITLAIYITLTVILSHHWTRYEVEERRKRRVRVIYFAGSALLWAFLLINFIFLLL